MKKSHATVPGMIVALVAAALVMALTPCQAWGQLSPQQVCANEDPHGDYDRDGFLNGEECQGLTAGTYPDKAVFLSWPGYLSPPGNKAPLNPAEPDLLVILVRANPSNIPADPLELVYRDQGLGGLGIHIREVPASEAGSLLNYSPNDPLYRTVVTRNDRTLQKAAKIQESLNPSQVLGRCDEWGTPNGLDNCWVFTRAIKDWVDSTCAGIPDNNCKDSSTNCTRGTCLYDHYIKHTIAHECGHDLKLRKTYVTKFGGYHYASSDDVIMSQCVDYRQSKSSVNWYIGKEYTAADINDFVIWEP